MESLTTAMSTQKLHQLHFVLIPLMAPGHLLPMVDLARLLARRNVKVTIMTTPLNAARVRANIDREIQSGSSISVQHFRFPNAEAGLPEGCESIDTLPSMDLLLNFAKAMCLLQEPVEEVFEKLISPSPTCVIHDKYLPFVADIAKKLQVPRITFDGTSCFTLLCDNSLYNSEVYENLSESEPFVVPGLPHRIVFKKSQLPEWFTLNRGQDVSVLREKTRKCEEEAYGVIVNSFEEFEEEYVKEYRRVTGRKVWCVGPVSLSNKDDLDKTQRGKPDSNEKEEEEEGQYLKWLDSWPARSVIYVCLGTLNFVPPEQLMELGLGLEATKRPFIWVLRDSYKREEMDKLLKEDGLEERVKGRGLIIRGWVPQVLILSHTAIGSFLTHCGWNSTLEGISNGLPLITFPLSSDQFYNEKVIVQLLEIGARVGAEIAVHLGEEDKYGVQVKREKVKEAIEKVMGEEDEESERIRERARNYAEKANRTLQKGGSSYLNLSLLIEDIIQY
ncbi:UDP-glycosyltransferase 73C3-like [Neltuma alba]|uniref:UDP-glycosyltransferase 73C3-like n=1 Tax=Neltuma alba TaxID=207710 RepID=UPI0010A48F5C|nr:UDP-glycosyltransferase 73C3-like [Prosopis alba]